MNGEVMARFRDRTDAGRYLAHELATYADDPNVRVLALPRGGVPVAFEVARALRVPLDVFLVRKVGFPGHEEYAIGAIASGGILVLDEDVMRRAGLGSDEVERVIECERRELERRERWYRGDRPLPEIAGRTVILIDDGLATGWTMRAAVAALRKEFPARIVVAVPVGAPDTCEDLEREVDEVVCVVTPEPMIAVGYWYEDFTATTDEEVHELLEHARRAGNLAAPRRTRETERTNLTSRSARARSEVEERPVSIATGDAIIAGTLTLPPGVEGVVVFAHGSGSSRHSPRNLYVARVLQQAGLGTLLIDLLTPAEEALDDRTAELRFDIGLLADRVVSAIWWLASEDATAHLPVGLFGASTGAGAALVAAAHVPDRVGAVVGRGGRPDLAGGALPNVQAPTLFIVGGNDAVVADLNRSAMVQMLAQVRLEIIPGATHLFPEKGAREEVALLARDWFVYHLGHHLAAAGGGSANA